MEDKYLKITKNNIEVSYKILAVFSSNKTNHNYIVYTDESKSEDGKTNIYASIFNPKELDKLYDIETKEDWEEVESIFEKLTNIE